MSTRARTTARRFGWALPLTTALSLMATLLAGHARADAAGDAALAKLVKAYAALPGYVSEVKFENIQSERGWTTTQAGVFRASFERAGNKLRYERPDIVLVSDDKRLMVKSNQIPGRYLDVAAPKSLAYAALKETFPYIAPPPAADLVLLLSPDPMEEFIRGFASPWAPFNTRQVKDVTVLPADEQKRAGIQADAELGTLTFRLDPENGLVSRVVFDRRLPEEAVKAGVMSRMTYAIVASPKAPSADDKPWTMDVAGMEAIASVPKWLGQDEKPGAGPGAGAEQDGPEKLVGQAAPAVALARMDGEAYKLADDKAKVVVLDFWATWCGPCAAWMPQLQDVAKWAREGKKDVAFYTINERETPEQIKRFMAMAKIDLPVLLDKQGEVMTSYKVSGIPTTVVISGGKVVNVHVGVEPTTKADLKKEIEAILDGKGNEAKGK
ncbi:MAG: TlpA disulfide reductase family protein [Planctomycetota bacterium]|nr:TlpA disulfide reductase family protein [Planctomycetota bacterium]